MATKTASKVQAKQEIYRMWEAAHPGRDLDMREVAAWAFGKGLWEPPKYDPIKALAKELSTAAREEYTVDPQGREVRKRHSYTYTDATGQKHWMFTDITTATPEKMRMSLQHRRRSALGDVVQTNRDRQSYNDNNVYGACIQMSFNFDEDLAELEHSGEYPDSPPEA